MWGPGEESMARIPIFCSKGYGIVYSNPRGSGGYGLILRGISTIGAQVRQVMLTALDKTTTKKAIRLSYSLPGGSYAGYLTAWIISHDNRFKQHVRNEVFMI
jgi:dipeptidyl aminopeptidase/acylaminoacyl peptidase